MLSHKDKNIIAKMISEAIVTAFNPNGVLPNTELLENNEDENTIETEVE